MQPLVAARTSDCTGHGHVHPSAALPLPWHRPEPAPRQSRTWSGRQSFPFCWFSSFDHLATAPDEYQKWCSWRGRRVHSHKCSGTPGGSKGLNFTQLPMFGKPFGSRANLLWSKLSPEAHSSQFNPAPTVVKLPWTAVEKVLQFFTFYKSQVPLILHLIFA